MIIVRLLSPSLLVGFGTTKVYSGMGADIVMESITLKIPDRVSMSVIEIYRQQSQRSPTEILSLVMKIVSH